MKIQTKKNINNIYMPQSITIQEHINLENLFYLYSLKEDKITQYFKSNTDTNYYTETHNILSNYVFDGKSNNEKKYFNNNCNRLYCNNSLQKLQNDISNFLCPNNCYDYDLKSARPSITRYLCKTHNLPCDMIDYYVNNRNNIMEKYNKSKDEIKNLIVKLSNIDNPKSCGIREIDEYIKQENQNKTTLLEIYKDILPEKDYEKKQNPISSKYCEIYYYFENKIVSSVVNKYIDNVNCIKFDGFVSRKYIELDEINELTKEYNVEWVIKPLDTRFTLGITNKENIDNKLNKYLYGKFTLFNNYIDTTSTSAEKSSKYLKHTIRFCKKRRR